MTRVTPNTVKAAGTAAPLTKGSNHAFPLLAPPLSLHGCVDHGVVVASTGTSYAAGLIGSDDVRNNSLTTMDIKDKTLKGRDIKNDVLGSNKIRNGSLKSRDFKAGQLPAGAVGGSGGRGPLGVGRRDRRDHRAVRRVHRGRCLPHACPDGH